jgi:hypothetical protein
VLDSGLLWVLTLDRWRLHALAHVRHEVLGWDAQFVPVALSVRLAVVALAELLNQLLSADTRKFLALVWDQYVDLVSRQVDHLVHRKNNLVHVQLLNNLICELLPLLRQLMLGHLHNTYLHRGNVLQLVVNHLLNWNTGSFRLLLLLWE